MELRRWFIIFILKLEFSFRSFFKKKRFLNIYFRLTIYVKDLDLKGYINNIYERPGPIPKDHCISFYLLPNKCGPKRLH